MAEGQGSSMFQADQERYRQVRIIEEEITEEKKSLLCESCVKERPSEGKRWLAERVAVFFCSDCKMYVCINCLPGHNSHKGVRVGREDSEGEERETSESERMLHLLWDGVMRESERERIEKFERSHVSIYDRVYVQHDLDQGRPCSITGLCVLENQRWVVCDSHNSCIQIFTLGSNVLQRYIRFVGSEPRPEVITTFRFRGPQSRPRVITTLRYVESEPIPQDSTAVQFVESEPIPQDSTAVPYTDSAPCDVTEILVQQISTEPNLASGSSSGVSLRDRAEKKKQCLIAVTLPSKEQIMFIDLSKKPAFIQKVIHTKRQCWSIQFYENKIFTTCKERRFDSSWSVYIYSTEGDELNMLTTGIFGHYRGPHLTIVSGRVYLTEWDNKVQCRNVEGQFRSEITIEGSGPVGISVDPDNNVYVCAKGQGKVYKLDADLTQYESVLDQTEGNIEGAEALCFYRNKLFISHLGSSSLNNYVTVVRLL